MASRRSIRIALSLFVIAAGVGGYLLWRPEPPPPIVGVVRTTEVRIAPEVGGQLAAINVHKGNRVRAGDVVAELFALELIASVAQARAALAAATASRDNVYAGVRAEEIAALALYFIVLPRIYGFSTLGQPLQLLALASLFTLATSFMGQAMGAWFRYPETPTLIVLGTSLPQLFVTGFSWPREAIPKPVLVAGYIFPSDFAIDGIVRIGQLGASLWEVAHDWLGIWCLAIIYFTLAAISAFLVKRRPVHG